MENKVLVEVIVPSIEKKYDIYLPVNKRIGNVIEYIGKGIYEFTTGDFKINDSMCLYNSYTGIRYDNNAIIRKTDIRNGTKLVLL
ncbi:MAG: hypothetical protein IKQ35_03290 [Bacilli bacterium]|nr:hypothetical protein [Bacilli bacterium]